MKKIITCIAGAFMMLYFTDQLVVADTIRIKPESAVAITQAYADMDKHTIWLLMPSVKLNDKTIIRLGGSEPLNILGQYEDYWIEADFPAGTVDSGDYLLTVTYDKNRYSDDDDEVEGRGRAKRRGKRKAEKVEVMAHYHLTIGAVGPAGPQGCQGTKGPKGDKGERGQQGLPGDTVVVGQQCESGTINQGYDLSGNIICQCDYAITDCDKDGYTLGDGDCAPDEVWAHPGRLIGQGFKRPTGSWDWDCDGKITKDYPMATTVPGQGGSWLPPCDNGWADSVPECGEQGTYIEKRLSTSGTCTTHYDFRKPQTCR